MAMSIALNIKEKFSRALIVETHLGLLKILIPALIRGKLLV